MRKIKEIFIHCSYTPASMDIGVKEIKKWHTDEPPKGNGWSDIGYHFVIRRDGTVEKGRGVSKAGAHALGWNANSIGVCLVGGKRGKRAQFNFTDLQMDALEGTVGSLCGKYKLQLTDVHGHNEVSKKLCPCFDVQAYFNGHEN